MRPRPPHKALLGCILFVSVLTLCTPYPRYEWAGAKKRLTQTVKQSRQQKTPADTVRQARPDSAAAVVWEPDSLPVEAASAPASPPRLDRKPETRVPAEPSRNRDDFLAGASPLYRIRVALGQNLRQASFSSANRMEIRSADAQRIGARGSITCQAAASSGAAVFVLPGGGKREISLPCTLGANSEFTIVRFGGKSYRGSMIVSPEQRGAFSVINYCDVEDYLRGVVPLEIGTMGRKEIEAMKAQAVAARTYTYKKMENRGDQAFDLLPDISDQVYGGVTAENALCNQAIRATRDLVIVYPGSASGGEDSLIFAYYHSTCGGKTSNIEDVWDKPMYPYLRSVDDCDENRRPFCSGSWTYTWEDSWPLDRLSKIINHYSREAFPQNPSSGALKTIAVTARTSCGRTKACAVATTEGGFTYGGDRLRFVLRRNVSGFPLLRSTLITDIASSPGSVVIRGKGFGHGIGMCQFGAIGRARAGQPFERIVKAYYTGVEIRKIERKK